MQLKRGYDKHASIKKMKDEHFHAEKMRKWRENNPDKVQAQYARDRKRYAERRDYRKQPGVLEHELYELLLEVQREKSQEQS